MKNMIYGSILDAQTPANCAHARVAVTRTRRGGLPRVPDLIRRPPNCSVENRLNCSVVVFKVLHNSRLRWTPAVVSHHMLSSSGLTDSSVVADYYTACTS